MVSNTRLYGASIAFASGLYSVWSATTPSRMVPSAWVMLVLGVVVLVHGAVLLTSATDRIEGVSGPLMVAYALVMLLNQALLGAGVLDAGGPRRASDGTNGGMNGGMDSGMNGSMDGGMASGMDGGAGMGAGPMAGGMGWDVGMVVLAALMLVSGLLMTRGGSMGDPMGDSMGDSSNGT